MATANPKFPFLIYAPTMRMPSRVGHSNNAYQAMIATLVRAHHAQRAYARDGMVFSSIAIPGFCAGAGAMPPDTVAGQMWGAYHNFNDNLKKPKTKWEDFIPG